ncbi:MAG: hypothetical protein A2Y33_12685 [Spirochaetes bacterium GWF1_51_8]|nr:MAG: hypothetical protein A2Y33_12685 [Spirochaetes bacterium GWF1_51_8]
MQILKANTADYPNPSISNMSSAHSFYVNDENAIFVLGEWNDEKQRNDNRHFLKYKLLQDTFDVERLPIPDEIRLGDFNHVHFDEGAGIVYAVSGISIDSLKTENLTRTDHRIYSFDLRKKTWKELYRFAPEIAVREVVYNRGRGELILEIVVMAESPSNDIKKLAVFGVISGRMDEYPFPYETKAHDGFNLIVDDRDNLFIYGGYDRDDNCYNEMYRTDAAKPENADKCGVEMERGRTLAFGVYIPGLNALMFIGGTYDGMTSALTSYLYYPEDQRWELIREFSPPPFDGTSVICFSREKNIVFCIDGFKWDRLEKKYSFKRKGIYAYPLDDLHTS